MGHPRPAPRSPGAAAAAAAVMLLCGGAAALAAHSYGDPAAPLLFAMPGHFDSVDANAASSDTGEQAREIHAGVFAAFAMQNRLHGGVGGRRLQLVTLEDYASPAEAAAMPARVFGNATAGQAPDFPGALQAIMFPGALNTVTLQGAARAAEMPIVAGVFIDDGLFGPGEGNQPFLHFSASVKSSASLLVHFAINGPPLARRIGILLTPGLGLESVVAELSSQLVAEGLPVPLVTPVTSRFVSEAQHADDFGAVVHAIGQLPPGEVPAVFMILSSGSLTAKFVEAVMGLPNVDTEDTFFVTTNIGVTLSPRAPVSGRTDVFRNVYVVSSTPNPSSAEFAVVEAYRGAVQWLLDMEADPAGAGDPAGTAPATAPAASAVPWSRRPNHFGVQGFVAGRFVVDALLRAGDPATLRPAALLAAVYATRRFSVADLELGPLRGGCTAVEAAAAAAGRPSYVGCHCNHALHQVFYSRVDGATGDLRPVGWNATGMENVIVATLSRECGVAVRDIHRSHVVLVIREAAAPASVAAVQAVLLAELEHALADERANGDMHHGLLIPKQVTLPVPTSTASLVDSRYSAVALVGASPAVSAAASRIQAGQGALPHLQLAPLSAEFPDRDPPVAPKAEGWINRVAVYPTLADLAMAAAAYANATAPSAPVSVVADSPALLAIGTQAAETALRRAPASATAAGVGSSAPELVRAAVAQLGGRGMLIAVSRRADVIVGVAAAAASSPAVTFVLAADEFAAEEALRGAGMFEAPPQNLMFSSGLASYADVSTASVAATPLLSRRAYARTVALATIAAYHSTVEEGAPASMAAAVFRARVLLAGATAMSGIDETPCPGLKALSMHPGGMCQCTKGINRFFVRPVAGGRPGNATPPLFTFAPTSCGAHFVPLPGSEMDQALVVGLSLGAAALVLVSALTAVVLYMLLCRRSGRCADGAPKDAAAPFAMVFTDIQGSTALWARAPVEMGEALDKHNHVIRSAVAEHRGYEVKTIGDAFMVAFKDIHDAVRFSMAVQEGLFAEDWGTDVFDALYGDIVESQMLMSLDVTHLHGSMEALPEVRPSTCHSDSTAPPPAETTSTQCPERSSLTSDGDGGGTEMPRLLADGIASILPLGNGSPTGHELVGEYKPSARARVWAGLRVRIGVHFGSGEIKLDEKTGLFDYFGTVVNTAARVEAVGHGGQTLVTAEAMAALSEAGVDVFNDPKVTASALGPQPLRGLATPVNIFQLLPAHLSGRRFPELRLAVEGGASAHSPSPPLAHSASGTKYSATQSPSGTWVESPAASRERSSYFSMLYQRASVASGPPVALPRMSRAVADASRAARLGPAAAMALDAVHPELLALLAPCRPPARAAVVAAVAGAWHVADEEAWRQQLHLRRASSRDAAPAYTVDDMRLLLALCKSMKAAEARTAVVPCRREREPGGDGGRTGSRSASRMSSQRSSPGASRRRSSTSRSRCTD